MVSIVDAVKEFCLTQGLNKTYWVAYSGGVDSHVLLHVLSHLRDQLPIQFKAIHIHHQLNPKADDWFNHCKSICDELSVDWVGGKINAKSATGESPEAIARTKRYAEFEAILAKDDILLTAHHQNDQAETLLLQLLRGAGPKGLAAMPRLKSLGLGWQGRPLLDVTRTEILHYAKLHQLNWIEDDSNAQINFARNFLRHQLFPMLQERWPTVTKTIARAADHCAEMQQLLESFAQEDLRAAQGVIPNTLSITYLKKLPIERQRLLLRTWLYQQHFLLPPAKKMQTILNTMLQAAADKLPHVRWGNSELRRYKDYLYVEKYQPNINTQSEWQWNLTESLIVPGLGVLHATRIIGQGLKVDAGRLIVRFRQGGESIRLPGRNIRHSLKKLFQVWQIPTWERDRTPLIYINDALVAVVGFAIADGFQAQTDEAGYQISIFSEPRE
jgi:tRNA(Ile)-lysidine synthase